MNSTTEATLKPVLFTFEVKYDEKRQEWYSSCEKPPFGNPIHCHADTIEELKALQEESIAVAVQNYASA